LSDGPFNDPQNNRRRRADVTIMIVLKLKIIFKNGMLRFLARPVNDFLFGITVCEK